MPAYLPPIGSPNFPPITPGWMNELRTSYFGCSMINSNYINLILYVPVHLLRLVPL